MPGGTAREALRDLRTLFRFGVVGDISDGQLLDRYVARRDEGAEEAFAMLVRRHGPMVFGVCRRVLCNSHEAEDAFQATFLVLARKASTIARRETLANWLFGVALRTAKDARSRTLRRRVLEEHVNKLQVIHAPGEDPAEELRAILDEELGRLPARLRAPVLLCELGALSRQEAARRLSIPEGTLSSRLARAKVLLRERLTRRGLGLSTALLTTGLAREAQAMALPHGLEEITIRAATLVAAGCSLTGLVAASVHSLTEEVCQAMLFAKLKGILFALVTVGAVTTGAIVLGQRPQQEQNQTAYDPTQARSEPDRLHAVEQKLDRILEALGRPLPAPHSPAGGLPNPDLAPTVVSTTTASTVGSNDLPPAALPTASSISLSADIHGSPGPGGLARRQPTDRLTNVEQRMDELERRLVEIERRVNQPLPPPVPPPPPSQRPGADNAPAPGAVSLPR
jgi:RNA polymerase sigma-70 factor (ECF subfamily)